MFIWLLASSLMHCIHIFL